MRRRALLLVLLLFAWPPPAAAAGADRHALDVRLDADRTERVVWRIQAPDGLRELAVPKGTLLVAAEGASGRVEGGRILFEPPVYLATLTLQLPPPDESRHPLYSRRLALPFGAAVELSLRAPEGFLLFHASHGELARDGRSLAYGGRGGVELVYAYRSPYDASTGLVELDEGLYHVIAPAGSAEAARRVAAIASEASRLAAQHAGLSLPSPIWVRFAPERAFGEEAGYYGDDGILALRRDALSGAALDGYPWRGAETLAHETFHLASLPHGDARLYGNVTWWLEGSARYSERFVSGVDGWRACEDGWCVAYQTQLNATQLRAVYDGSFPFAPGWREHDEARYRHAAYLVAAYVDRFGGEAYRAAWEDVRAGSRSPTCPCDEAWLLQILVRHSGGRATRDELYRPFGDLRAEDRAAFDARVARLIAGEPAEGAPVAFRPEGMAQPAAPTPRRLAVTPPLVGAPDAAVRARVEGVRLLEDEAPSGPADARLVVRLDGAPAAPATLRAVDGNVTIGFVGLPPGERVVEVEAVSLHGVAFEPPLRANARFTVHPAYDIELRPPADVAAALLLLAGTVRDRATREPLANVSVALYVDGSRSQGTRTDEAGQVGFALAQRPAEGALLALVVEDVAGAPLAEAAWTLPARKAAATPPSETAPAARILPEETRGTPGAGLLMALAALAAAFALRARRRG